MTADPERSDPTRRFTDRVGDYARYRPSYPPELLQLLRQELGLRPDHVVADVGSGTGLLSEPFLAAGNVVYAVEPNRTMAAAAHNHNVIARLWRGIAPGRLPMAMTAQGLRHKIESGIAHCCLLAV